MNAAHLSIRTKWLCLLVINLGLAVRAQDANGLIGTYYKDTGFENQGLQRVDPFVNFSWGRGSPAPELPVDNFCVRWTGQVRAEKTGYYFFHTDSDDGTRLWVNGRLLIDNWSPHAVAEDTGMISLEAGRRYDLVLEYLELKEDAVCRLSWSTESSPKQIIPHTNLFPQVVSLPADSIDPAKLPAYAHGLLGCYYPQLDFGGRPRYHLDPKVDFDWGIYAPDVLGIPPESFSVRWTGQLQPPQTGDYDFQIECNAGERLWVDDQLVIDHWLLHTPNIPDEGSIHLEADKKHKLVLEYFQTIRPSVCKLFWNLKWQSSQIIPASCLYPVQLPPPPGQK